MAGAVAAAFVAFWLGLLSGVELAHWTARGRRR